MADMGADRQRDDFRIELESGSRPAHPAGIFLARMFGDDVALGRRAVWKKTADALGKLGDVALVLFGATLCGPLAGALPRWSIGLAFALRPLQSRLFDEHPLTLVPPSTPAEPDDDRMPLRVLGGPPRERGVSPGQEHEMIDPETGGADDAALLHAEEGPLLALDPARPASRSVGDLEHDDVLGRIVRGCGISGC